MEQPNYNEFLANSEEAQDLGQLNALLSKIKIIHGQLLELSRNNIRSFDSRQKTSYLDRLIQKLPSNWE